MAKKNKYAVTEVKKTVELQVVNSNAEWDELSSFEGLLVVDVFSAWCGPCRAVIPTFERVQFEFPGRPLKFAAVCSDHVGMFKKYKGKSQPVFMLYKGGVLKETIEGVNVNQISKLVTTHIPLPKDDQLQPTMSSTEAGVFDTLKRAHSMATLAANATPGTRRSGTSMTAGPGGSLTGSVTSLPHPTSLERSPSKSDLGGSQAALSRSGSQSTLLAGIHGLSRSPSQQKLDRMQSQAKFERDQKSPARGTPTSLSTSQSRENLLSKSQDRVPSVAPDHLSVEAILKDVEESAKRSEKSDSASESSARGVASTPTKMKPKPKQPEAEGHECRSHSRTKMI